MSYSILLYYYYIIVGYYYIMGKHDLSTHNTASSSFSSFYDKLTSVAKYSSFQEFSTLYYSDTPIGTSNIVFTIEFNKDGEFFAVGGYTKRIKVRLLLV